MSGGTAIIDYSSRNSNVSCDRLQIITTITNIDVVVYEKIEKDDVLFIFYDEKDDRLLVVWNNEIVGDILTPEIKKMKECIKKGSVYIADVIEKTGGCCKIKVHSR